MIAQPNWKKVENALAHIAEHPETWNQGSWVCGTTACLAGHIAHQNSWQTAPIPQYSVYRAVPEKNPFVQKPGFEPHHIRYAAELEILGGNGKRPPEFGHMLGDLWNYDLDTLDRLRLTVNYLRQNWNLMVRHNYWSDRFSYSCDLTRRQRRKAERTRLKVSAEYHNARQRYAYELATLPHSPKMQAAVDARKAEAPVTLHRPEWLHVSV